MHSGMSWLGFGGQFEVKVTELIYIYYFHKLSQEILQHWQKLPNRSGMNWLYCGRSRFNIHPRQAELIRFGWLKFRVQRSLSNYIHVGIMIKLLSNASNTGTHSASTPQGWTDYILAVKNQGKHFTSHYSVLVHSVSQDHIEGMALSLHLPPGISWLHFGEFFPNWQTY